MRNPCGPAAAPPLAPIYWHLGGRAGPGQDKLFAYAVPKPLLPFLIDWRARHR
jgi:hypothetical protein